MQEFTNAFHLWAVLVIAVLAPIIAELVPRVRMPVVVLEILLGIIAGPHVLGWAHTTPMIDSLAHYGLAFLFFLAGFEIDLRKIQGRPITLAASGWLLSLGIGFAVGFILNRSGMVLSDVLVGVALTTTALGALLPALRDAGELDTPFGAYALAAGAMGEVGPIIVISVALTTGGVGGPIQVVLLVLFVGIVLATAWVALRLQPPRLVAILRRTMRTSARLPIRVSILLLATLFVLSGRFGLDSILGALAAGMIVALVTDSEEGEEVRSRLESIGYGFFVPIFFVVTGIKFDLSALLHSATALVRVPLFLALFLLVRGVPVLLYRREFARHDLAALALISATALPLVVAITEIGVASGQMRGDTAAALVGAGMLSVLLYPWSALLLRRQTAAEQTVPHTDGNIRSR